MESPRREGRVGPGGLGAGVVGRTESRPPAPRARGSGCRSGRRRRRRARSSVAERDADVGAVEEGGERAGRLRRARRCSARDDRAEARAVGGIERVARLEDLRRRPDRGHVGQDAVDALAEERVAAQAVREREHRLALVLIGAVEPEHELAQPGLRPTSSSAGPGCRRGRRCRGRRRSRRGRARPGARPRRRCWRARPRGPPPGGRPAFRRRRACSPR